MNNYWLEIELWKTRQKQLNQLYIVKKEESSPPRFYDRLSTLIGKMLIIVGQYLQSEQPSYRQTRTNSNT
jgi:hypothetical protein